MFQPSVRVLCLLFCAYIEESFLHPQKLNINLTLDGFYCHLLPEWCNKKDNSAATIMQLLPE